VRPLNRQPGVRNVNGVNAVYEGSITPPLCANDSGQGPPATAYRHPFDFEVLHFDIGESRRSATSPTRVCSPPAPRHPLDINQVPGGAHRHPHWVNSDIW